MNGTHGTTGNDAGLHHRLSSDHRAPPEGRRSRRVLGTEIARENHRSIIREKRIVQRIRNRTVPRGISTRAVSTNEFTASTPSPKDCFFILSSNHSAFSTVYFANRSNCRRSSMAAARKVVRFWQNFSKASTSRLISGRGQSRIHTGFMVFRFIEFLSSHRIQQ